MNTKQILVKEEDKNIFNLFWPALMLAGLVCAMVVIIYGVESVAPGVHDAFHDFRHAIGIPCH